MPAEHIFCVVCGKLVLVHHDAGGEVNGAAGDRFQGQAGGFVFRSCHRRHQPLVIYERDQMLDRQVRDRGVVL